MRLSSTDWLKFRLTCFGGSRWWWKDNVVVQIINRVASQDQLSWTELFWVCFVFCATWIYWSNLYTALMIFVICCRLWPFVGIFVSMVAYDTVYLMLSDASSRSHLKLHESIPLHPPTCQSRNKLSFSVIQELIKNMVFFTPGKTL